MPPEHTHDEHEERGQEAVKEEACRRIRALYDVLEDRDIEREMLAMIVAYTPRRLRRRIEAEDVLQDARAAAVEFALSIRSEEPSSVRHYFNCLTLAR